MQCAPGLVSRGKLALGKIKTRCYFTHMGVTRPHDKPGLGGKKVTNSIWGLVEFSPVSHMDQSTNQRRALSSPQLASCCCAFPPHSGHPLSCFVCLVCHFISAAFLTLLCGVFIFHLSQPASVFGCTLQTLLQLVELLVSI